MWPYSAISKGLRSSVHKQIYGDVRSVRISAKASKSLLTEPGASSSNGTGSNGNGNGAVNSGGIDADLFAGFSSMAMTPTQPVVHQLEQSHQQMKMNVAPPRAPTAGEGPQARFLAKQREEQRKQEERRQAAS